MVVLAFLTHVISGNSNLHFAIFRRLLSLPRGEAPSQIHIIGDEPVRKRVDRLPSSPHTSVTFHVLDQTDVLANVGPTSDTMRGPPLSFFTPAGIRVFQDVVVPLLVFRPDVYLRRYAQLLSIFQDIKPDLVVVNILLGTAGFDACNALGLRFVMEAPISSLDVERMSQPGGQGLWKYPVNFTATRYPVPFWDIPLNVANALLFMLGLIFHPARRRLDAARKDAGFSGSTMEPAWDKAECFIYPSLPEIEYPHVPHPKTVFAGPILTPEAAVSAIDYPDISAFLARGRTVLVNMGSLFTYTAADAEAMMQAFLDARQRLRQDGGLQILWKLPRASQMAALLEEKLGGEPERKQWIWIEEWIEPPALAVLQHSNIVASAHHGGANSVHEATFAGVPQVILPQWLDLYTYASRVETLGHGIYANRGAEAKIDARQFADALVRVCSNRPGEPGAAMHARAEELGRLCRAAKGDERATNAILAAARGEQLKGVYF